MREQEEGGRGKVFNLKVWGVGKGGREWCKKTAKCWQGGGKEEGV